MGRKWSYKTYGKTALGKGFKIGGIEEYLAKAEALGKNIDDIVKEAINESVKPIVHDMKQGQSIHYDTGEVYNAIEATPAKAEGNYIYSSVGINFDEHPEAIHAVFQEYGDSHTTGFPDPFIRPAFDLNVDEVKQIQKKVLKKAGVPTG
jgi:HK97 gp10 family phage protein